MPFAHGEKEEKNLKKRVLSAVMALALCLSLLPGVALAAETEGTAQMPPAVEEAADPANGEAKQENQPAAPEQESQSAEQEEQQEDSASKQDEAVAAVQAMIDALPDASELDGMDDTARESAYLAASEAYEAYDALREEQQSALTGAEKMIAILEWATRQVTPLADDVDVSDHTDHTTGWTEISTADALTGITAAGYYYLTKDVTIDSTWEPQNGVVLCLNGNSITANGEFNAITIGKDVTFTLCDCKVGQTGKVTHGKDANDATFTGSGVYVNGTFNMYGGSITDNTVGTNSGGGVYVSATGTFNMYGGTISDNNGANGGGVYVNSSSTFTMSGSARIANNQVTGNSSGGGGVYVGTSANFDMNGGTISGNSSVGYGGGVYSFNGTFTMEGGSITQNKTVKYNGGGVWTNSSFTVSGNVKITDNTQNGKIPDNVCLSYIPITIGTKGLTQEARIGVTKTLNNTGESFTVATGAANKCTKDNFFADKDDPYGIMMEPVTGTDKVNVNLYNGLPHKHPICGAEHKDINGHTGTCAAVEWTPWDGTDEITYDSDTKTAYVYLTADVVRESALTVADGYKLYLCLNGHSLTKTTSGSVITVGNIGKRGSGATLSLCDCKGGGEITHRASSSNKSGAGVSLGHKSTFDMYGGSITDNSNGTGGGVSMGSDSEYGKNKFNMYGGSITNNEASNGYGDGGGGVHNLFGTFTMYGGSITKNHADKARNGGGGVYLARTGTFIMKGGSITDNIAQKGGGVYVDSIGFTVSGDVKITGNTDKDGEANNVYLVSGNTIRIGGALTGGEASIGVTTESTIADKNYLPIATSGSREYKLKDSDLNAFTSDNTAYGKQLFRNSVVFTKGELHAHPICGKTGCTDWNHTDQIWQPISNETELRAATAGYYYLTQNVELSTIWKPATGVNLCLNGCSITGPAIETAITVSSNVTFTLTDCNSSNTGNGKVTHNKDAKGRGVYVNGGTFKMYGGSITGNMPSSGSGGGVDMNGGRFEMYGGSITGNKAASDYGGGGVYVSNSGQFTMSGSASITGNTAKCGGGVYVDKKGAFTMESGTIGGTIGGRKGNTANCGGGVYVCGGKAVNDRGSFTMTNGSITGNTAESISGGVYVGEKAKFTMNNGSITGNEAENSDGGGVYVNSGTFTMTDGSITGNTAHRLGGGGVFVEGNATFTMTDGTISGNTANVYGGGVYVESGTFTVSNTANITGNCKGGILDKDTGKYTGGTKNNVYLTKGRTITIGKDGLTAGENGAKIGVTTAIKPTDNPKVQFATGANNPKLNYTTIFTPDAADQGYVVTRDDSGNLFLNAHQHRWSYTANEATITATCENCPLATGESTAYSGSITIKAPAVPEGQTLTYDGSAKAATVTKTQWSGDVSISYKVKTGDGENDWGALPEDTAAPTDAGTYTASITLGNATASVEYTIAKATPSVGNWQGYPQAQSVFSGNAIQNPTSLTIYLDGKPSNLIPVNQLKFNWYNATKNGNDYVKGDALDKNPTDAGDYIIEAVFAGDDNINAATSARGLTISKAQNANNGVSIEVPLTVYPVSGEYIYDVDIAKALNNIPHGGDLEPNATYGGISTNANFVKSTKWDNGKLYVTMSSLAGITGTTLGSITVNLTSKNYTVVPVVVNITLQPKRKVQDISVSMDNWTYGEKAKTPWYAVVAGAEATVTYAKADGTALSERPTDAGKYTVTVSYETATEIHTGTAKFTIAPKTLTQDDLDGIPNKLTKVYDGTDQHTESIRLADNDTRLNITVDKSKITYNNANAGKATSATLSLEGIALGPNYKFADSFTSITVPAEITQRAITVQKVTAADRTYKKDNKDVDVSVIFKDSNDSEITLVKGTDYTATGTMDTDTATGDAGEKDVAVTVKLKNGNYSMTDYTGTAKVKIWKLPAPTVTAPQLPQRWNDTTEKTVTPEWTGIPEDAGTTTFSTTGTIFPENYITFGRDYSVAVATGALTYAFTGVTAADVNKVITVKYNISMENYMETPVEVKILITDRMVQEEFKFTEGTKTVTYGDPNFTVTADGAVTGSSVTYSSSDESVATVDSATGKVHIVGAGTAVITAKASETAEYNEKTVSYTLTVGKKQITIPAADATVFTYNGKPQTYALAEDGAYTITGNKQTNANETGYSVTAALKDTANTQWADGTTANKTYTFVIKKAVITVKAADKTAYVGDKAPDLSKPELDKDYTVSGLVGEDKLDGSTVVLAYEKDPDMTKVGTAVITVTGGILPSENYELVHETGTLTITTRPSSGGGAASYPVSTPKADGGTVKSNVSSAHSGDTVTLTVTPNSGYEVGEITVKDAKGNTVKVTDKGNGKYTFTQPASSVTVAVSFREIATEPVFKDVPANAYYADAVAWAVKNGITNGIGNDLFGSGSDCTRAEIVTFLWRAAGSPEPKATGSFTDVNGGSYYAKAVAWAVENGITEGTGNGKFSPDKVCSRAQAVTFLARALSAKAASAADFTDVPANSYYAGAVGWAAKNGVTEGVGGGKFAPNNDCTRAQIVTFLYRAYQGK